MQAVVEKQRAGVSRADVDDERGVLAHGRHVAEPAAGFQIDEAGHLAIVDDAHAQAAGDADAVHEGLVVSRLAEDVGGGGAGDVVGIDAEFGEGFLKALDDGDDASRWWRGLRLPRRKMSRASGAGFSRKSTGVSEPSAARSATIMETELAPMWMAVVRAAGLGSGGGFGGGRHRESRTRDGAFVQSRMCDFGRRRQTGLVICGAILREHRRMPVNGALERYWVKPGAQGGFPEARQRRESRSSMATARRTTCRSSTRLQDELQELQKMLYAQNKHRILVVMQAMDTGGKDGCIKHVFSHIDPQGIHVRSFKKPTRGGAGARFPLAGPLEGPAARPARDFQPQPLRGHHRRAGEEDFPGRGLETPPAPLSSSSNACSPRRAPPS